MSKIRLDSNNACVWCGEPTDELRTITIDNKKVVVNLCKKCEDRTEKEIVELIGKL